MHYQKILSKVFVVLSISYLDKFGLKLKLNWYYSSVVVLQEQQAYTLSVYPNPSLGSNFQLNLPETNSATPITVFLKDLMGKVLTKSIVEKGKTIFSFEDIVLPSAGIYVVELSIDQQHYSTRVSVE